MAAAPVPPPAGNLMNHLTGRMSSWFTRCTGGRVALLGVFFFLNELGSYFTGVLACTLLVKRAGAECLPAVYILLNLVCIPVTMLVILHPPRSSQAMIRRTMVLMLGMLALAIPVTGSSNVLILGAIFVVARAGKTMVTTFDAGLVSETLPIREVRMATPRLLACQTAGLVAGGLLLDPLISAFGNEVTYIILWSTTAAALGSVLLLGSSDPVAPEGVLPAVPMSRGPGPAWVSAIRSALQEVVVDPLPRLMGLIAFFTVSLRYLIEFVSSDAQARHFTSEKEMAAFAGNFEAGLSLTVVVVQLAVLGPAMRHLRLGGLALVLPVVLVISLTGAILSRAFETIVATQFLYWLCLDGFAQAARQVMMGAVPLELRSRTPVLFTVMSIGGSLFASLLLVPLTGHGTSVPVLVAAWLLAVCFVLASIPAGRIYTATLSRTLARMGAGGADRSGEVAAGDPHDERTARIGALLASPVDELRLRAVQECLELGPAAAESLLTRRLRQETDPIILRTLVEVLARWRSRPVLDVLLERSRDRDSRVRADALEDLAYFSREPEVSALIQARLEVSRSPGDQLDTRERAAVLVAVLRSSRDPDSIGAALDRLLDLSTDAARPASRAAAARVMMKLGNPFFFPDLVRLLFDDALEVRSAALTSLIALNDPAAHEALGAALAVETDPRMKVRLASSLTTLADRSAGDLLDRMDRFTAVERRQVRSILSRSNGPGDPRPAILLAALAMKDERSRRNIIRLVHDMYDDRHIETLSLCISRESGRLDLEVLLDAIESQRLAPSDPLIESLAPLVEGELLERLITHVTDLTRRFWQSVIPRDGLEDRSGLIERIITAASLGTRSPGRAGELMHAAIGSDRQRSSVALEVLEGWIPLPLGDVLLPVLGAMEEMGREGFR